MVESALQVTTAAGVVAVGLMFIILVCMLIYVLGVTLFFAVIEALHYVRGE